MEHEGQSIDALLSGEPIPEVEDVIDTPEPAPESGQPRGPDGKFAPKQQEETGVEPQETAEPVPPTDKLPQEDYKAIREEREKRQALQAELEALKQQFLAAQQPKEPPAPPPSVWEDENAWGGQLVNSAVAQSTYQSKLLMSEMLVSQQHEDFTEIKDKLVEFVGNNPAINQQVAESQHPWMTAYKAFKNQQTMQELGATNLDDLRAKLREELLAEMRAQVPVTHGQQVPPTLTTERNVGSRSGPEWGGPKSLTELLG